MNKTNTQADQTSKRTRLEVLQASLQKKQALLDRRFEEHFADVRRANGQPLNDKRCGASTLSRWDRQSQSISRAQEEIKKTETAIEKEQWRLQAKQYNSELLASFPLPIREAVERGDLCQWQKYPNRFFVSGVDKGRLIWDQKKNKLLYSHYQMIPTPEQKKRFGAIANALWDALKSTTQTQ